MMRVTVLSENTVRDDRLQAEHGLSLYIETGGRRLLFDMGQSSRFADHARMLGVDLRTVDTAVLSHGHYDHGGGLRTFLEQNETAPVYVSRFAFGAHYNGTEKYIGLDRTLCGHPRLRETAGTVSLGDGLTLYASLEQPPRRAVDTGGLTCREGDVYVPEEFRHEQVFLCEEDGQRVLFSGCAHKGIVNLLEWFRPDVFVGGCHLSKVPLDGTLEEVAEELGRYHTVLYVCHCTGTAQAQFLKERLPSVTCLSAGDTVDIGVTATHRQRES